MNTYSQTLYHAKKQWREGCENDYLINYTKVNTGDIRRPSVV